MAGTSGFTRLCECTCVSFALEVEGQRGGRADGRRGRQTDGWLDPCAFHREPSCRCDDATPAGPEPTVVPTSSFATFRPPPPHLAGEWRNLQVAIKSLILRDVSTDAARRRRECDVLKAALGETLTHPNVVRRHAARLCSSCSSMFVDVLVGG